MKKIPAFRLVAEPLSDEARRLPGFKWAGPEAGKRHQLGGEPTAWAAEHWPVCKCCAERMTFYGQLDSLNDEFNLMDLGVVCVFVCFDCFEVEAMLDSG